MACFHPITINTSEGYKLVPCGRCPDCLFRYRDSWRVRLEHEFEFWNYQGLFFTLTYDDDHIPVIYDTTSGEEQVTLSKSDARSFLKKLRNKWDYYARSKLDFVSDHVYYRYFLVGEYGSETKRPHFHFLLFSDYLDVLSSFIYDIWDKGFIDSRPIITERIQYVCKYTLKSLVPWADRFGIERPFAMMSKGIGSHYLSTQEAKDFYSADFRPYALDSNGFSIALPRYYKNHLYDPITWSNFAQSVEEEAWHRDEVRLRGELQGNVPKKQRRYFSEQIAKERVLARRIQDSFKKDIL